MNSTVRKNAKNLYNLYKIVILPLRRNAIEELIVIIYLPYDKQYITAGLLKRGSTVNLPIFMQLLFLCHNISP